jgi:hypothetical protein
MYHLFSRVCNICVQQFFPIVYQVMKLWCKKIYQWYKIILNVHFSLRMQHFLNCYIVSQHYSAAYPTFLTNLFNIIGPCM